MSEIVDLFSRILCDQPQRPLIHLPRCGQTFTASDLWTRAECIRRLMETAGVGTGRPIVSAVGNRPDSIALLLACRVSGIPLLPLDARTTWAEAQEVAVDFGATAILLPAGTVTEAAGRRTSLGHELDFVLFDQVASDAPCCQGAAVLKMSSGSSGRPKATFTTEAQLVVDAAQIVEAMGVDPDDTQIAAIPLSHSYGLGNLVMPLLMQGTAIVMRESFAPHQLLEDARSHAARIFPGVPFMFDHFLSTPLDGGWPPPLSLLISAGAPIEEQTVRTFREHYGVKIHSFYGTSETGGISYDDTDELPDQSMVGRALPGVTIALRGGRSEQAEGGRVFVSGDAVARGYVGAGSASEGFVDGGFLTGDFGRFNAQGDLVLMGRVSSFINVAGRKVHPDEIERVLCAMPAVAQARVIGVPDALRGEVIVAGIVPGAAGLNAVAIRQFCAARLAPYKIPRAIILLPALPLTDRGKFDRRQLEALAQAHVASHQTDTK